jgi:hypothetical protein
MSVMRGEDGGDDLGRRAESSEVASRLLSQPLRNLGVGVTAIVLGATALFGGLEEAEAEVPRLAGVRLGETVHAAPYDITLRKVIWVDELPGTYPTEKGNRWLAVTATVVNTHHESLFGAVELKDAVALSGVEGLVAKPEKRSDDASRFTDRVEASYLKVLADSSDLSPVSPRVPYEMVFLFEQKQSAPPPTEVTVQIVRHTWREGSLDGFLGWFDPTVIARSTLPMTESEQQVEEKEAAREAAEAADDKPRKKKKAERTEEPADPDAGSDA